MKTLLGAAMFLVCGAFASAATPGCTSGTGVTPGGVTTLGIGDPCTPSVENDATFLGFNEQEVNLESGSPSCKTSVCLINHFRGRVSCPYGQAIDGTAPAGGQVCTTPNNKAPVTGVASSAKKAIVAPQCVDRSAARAVYCSCRCANENGATNDGAAYCACPDGFACTNVVSSIGSGSAGIAGSYCVKQGTIYDANTACSQGDCDPVAKKCQ